MRRSRCRPRRQRMGPCPPRARAGKSHESQRWHQRHQRRGASEGACQSVAEAGTHGRPQRGLPWAAGSHALARDRCERSGAGAVGATAGVGKGPMGGPGPGRNRSMEPATKERGSATGSAVWRRHAEQTAKRAVKHAAGTLPTQLPQVRACRDQGRGLARARPSARRCSARARGGHGHPNTRAGTGPRARGRPDGADVIGQAAHVWTVDAAGERGGSGALARCSTGMDAKQPCRAAARHGTATDERLARL